MFRNKIRKFHTSTLHFALFSYYYGGNIFTTFNFFNCIFQTTMTTTVQ